MAKEIHQSLCSDSSRTGLKYSEEYEEDRYHNQILESIEALKKFEQENKSYLASTAKRRIFWETVEEIAGQQL